MRKTILTIIIGTLLLFIWNAISWMALPFHSNSLNTIPESAFNSQTLKAELPKDGIYHYPGLPENNSQASLQKLQEKLKEGPRITFMAYQNGPTQLFELKTFGLNLLFHLITVSLLLYLIKNQRDHSLKKIFLICFTVGLIIGFAGEFPKMNWFHFPLAYTLPNLFDHLVSFSLLGLLFGLYTFKPKKKLKNNLH